MPPQEPPPPEAQATPVPFVASLRSKMIAARARSVRARLTRKPDISNNVGSVKYFLNAPLCSLRRVVFVVLLDLCIDDHGPLVIFRSASVRPRHLFDPYFDHDYFFELPFRGSGMPHQVHGVLLHAMSGSELSRVRTEL